MSEQSDFPDIFAGQTRTPFTSLIDPHKAKMAPPGWLMWGLTIAIAVIVTVFLSEELPDWANLAILLATIIGVHVLMDFIYRCRYLAKQKELPSNEPPPPDKNMTLLTDELTIGYWRKILKPFPEMTWVLFTHGTCVLVPNSIQDPKTHAIEHLRLFGRSETGHSSADMTVIYPNGFENLVVIGCHSPAIFVLVSAIWTVTKTGPAVAAFVGRNARQFDAQSLNVIHVEKGGAPDQPAA